MVRKGSRVMIAAPTLAELLRRPPKEQRPLMSQIEFVAFDADAARRLAEKLPQQVHLDHREGTAQPKNYIRYDAMIVACAVRHRAHVFVSTDTAQRAMANQAGLITAVPSDYLKAQTTIPFPKR
jgi:predicted nucleic acid-binding protein